MAVETTIDVDDVGRLNLREVNVKALDQANVTSEVLKTVVPGLVKQAGAEAESLMVGGPVEGGGARFEIASAAAQAQRISTARPQMRRTYSPDLTGVATEYRTAEKGGETPVNAVARRFDVELPAAYLYIDRAREAGLI